MSSIPTLPGITSKMIDTPRLKMHALFSGPENGTPVLFVHGNASSATFWEETMLKLPGEYRGIAVDLRGYGDTEDKLIDATRGYGDWVDDIIGFTQAIGAKVKIRLGDRTIATEVRYASAYLSASDPTIHVGLKPGVTEGTVEITWSSKKQSVHTVRAATLNVIEEPKEPKPAK